MSYNSTTRKGSKDAAKAGAINTPSAESGKVQLRQMAGAVGFDEASAMLSPSSNMLSPVQAKASTLQAKAAAEPNVQMRGEDDDVDAADEVEDAAWAKKVDAAVARVGKLLKKWSKDPRGTRVSHSKMKRVIRDLQVMEQDDLGEVSCQEAQHVASHLRDFGEQYRAHGRGHKAPKFPGTKAAQAELMRLTTETSIAQDLSRCVYDPDRKHPKYQ